MAILFLLVALPSPADESAFRHAMVLNILDRFFAEGGEPIAMMPAQTKGLRAAIRHFDTNHNGKLEPDERSALLRFLKIAE
jgi:hypothetical protein